MDNLQSVPIAQNIQESVDSLSGLTINDLNKYLPALQTAEDLSLEIDHLKEGVFGQKGSKASKNFQVIVLISLLQSRQRAMDESRE